MTPSITAQHHAEQDIQEIRRDLAAPRARIAPKYFYDPLGSMLFAAICETPEYYPTRTEAGILPLAATAAGAQLGPGATLVDLGAGDCRKADAILPLLGCARYVAVDISIDYVRNALRAIRARHRQVAMSAQACDLAGDWTLGTDVAPGRRLFFYPGSSIGNYTPAAATAFLERVRRNAGDDGALLIGIDLVKDRAVLEAAYDDALGITAAFNRNVLNHVNRRAGTDFDPRQWRHVSFFDPGQSRIEMHLEARGAQRVRWPGGGRDFAAGERIHTEDSYKYSVDGFSALLAAAGWQVRGHWSDPRQWFAVFLAQAGRGGG